MHAYARTHNNKDISKVKRPGTEVITIFMLNQLSIKLIILINDKMPTIVCILQFISMKKTSESLKAKRLYFFTILPFMSNRNFMLS